MPKTTVTLADFETLKNEMGLVPMTHVKTLGTEFAGQTFGYSPEVALRMFERDMAEPFRGFRGTPDGEEADKNRARAAAEEEAGRIQAEREKAERERVLMAGSRTALGSVLASASGAPAPAAQPQSAADAIEQEQRDEGDGGDFDEDFDEDFDGGDFDEDFEGGEGEGEGEGDGEQARGQNPQGSATAATPAIPATWRKDHHLVRIRLAKSIIGRDVKTTDEADKIIEAEVQRRAGVGGGGTGGVTSGDVARRT